MYSIDQLNTLASDPAFVDEVRDLAARILSQRSMDGHGIREVGPLLRYGPDCPGVALRLLFVPRFIDLEGELAAVWAPLVHRVRAMLD
jgi:hypothetical protein